MTAPERIDLQSMPSLRVVIAGGGTGGHVFPALAVAAQLQATLPGSDLLFIGSRGGLEERVVPAQGHRLELLEVGKLRGAGVRRALGTILRLPEAVGRGLSLLHDFAPDVVVGVGGYASGPVALAATLLGLPVVLLEQNAVPGTTNRVLAHLAEVVVISFRGAARHLPAGRTVLLGNPVRPELLRRIAAARQERGGAERRAPVLLVLGGSQGARAVNELVVGAAPALLAAVPQLRLVHQTGAADVERVRQRYREAGVPARVEAFFEDMAEVLTLADLALSRSGATTLAELCAAGVPAVLIPYPFAADDHQGANAADLVEAGGAVMVRQAGLDAAELARRLVGLLRDEGARQRMGQAMRRCSYPDAAAAVVRALEDVARTARPRPLARLTRPLTGLIGRAPRGEAGRNRAACAAPRGEPSDDPERRCA